MQPKRAPNTERAAECQHLVEEIRDFLDELNTIEQKFIEDMNERLIKYGPGTFISDDQYKWIQEIYERVC